MPRRIPDYPLAFIGWNYIATIGSIITFISTLVFFVLPCFMNVKIFLNFCNNLADIILVAAIKSIAEHRRALFENTKKREDESDKKEGDPIYGY